MNCICPIPVPQSSHSTSPSSFLSHFHQPVNAYNLVYSPLWKTPYLIHIIDSLTLKIHSQVYHNSYLNDLSKTQFLHRAYHSQELDRTSTIVGGCFKKGNHQVLIKQKLKNVALNISPTVILEFTLTVLRAETRRQSFVLLDSFSWKDELGLSADVCRQVEFFRGYKLF